MRIWITFFVVLGLSACTKAPLPAGEAKLINTSLETSNLPDGVWVSRFRSNVFTQ